MRSSEELFTADYADIDTMTKEELEEYIKIAEEQEHKFDKKQHAVKILLNSLYGALGTPYFRFFNIHCAEAITLTGQATTAQSFKLFNDFLNGILGTDKDYAIASDTDSTDFSTLININGEEIAIGDYYLQHRESLPKDKDVVEINGDLALTSDGVDVIQRPVKYIMAHKVKKKMYRIKVNGKRVDITEDHSVMVLEDGIMKSIKPKELIPGIHTIMYIEETDNGSNESTKEGGG